MKVRGRRLFTNAGASALLISEQILNNNEDAAGRPSQMLGQFGTVEL